MKNRFDKIVTVAVSTLIGYYLGLSIFRGYIWNLLIRTLPPINNRHLPRYYTGIMSAFIIGAIGYLLYIIFIEKISFGKGKRKYTLGIVALFLLPLMTIISFRTHSITYVKKVESSAPTGFYLKFKEPNIVFETSKNAGAGFGKSVIKRGTMGIDSLETMGEALSKLELVKASREQENFMPESKATIWIDYTTDKGKWYSRILNCDGDYFQESAGQDALYKGVEFGDFLMDLDNQLKDLNTYNSGEIIHTSLITEDNNDDNNDIVTMPDEDLNFLLSSLGNDNKIMPQDNIVTDFQAILDDQKYITNENTHIYAFSIKNQSPEGIANIQGDMILENVIIYDSNLGVAYFEGDYFDVDLSTILK